MRTLIAFVVCSSIAFAGPPFFASLIDTKTGKITKKLAVGGEVFQVGPLTRDGKKLITYGDGVKRGRRKLEGEYLQSYRVVQVLEMIGPLAKGLLKEYAAGEKGAYLTQEAEAALERLP